MPYMIENDVLMSFYDLLMLYNDLIDQSIDGYGSVIYCTCALRRPSAAFATVPLQKCC